MEEHTNKKDRLEDVARMEKKDGSFKTKGIVIAVVAALFLGFFVYAVTATKKKSSEPVVLSNSGWVRGNTESTVTLTEFGDFQCPACKVFEPIFEQVVKDYDKKIKIVYKHFPLKSVHPNAMGAAIAAESAGKQNKFWEYHDLLFAKQEEWSGLPNPESKFMSYAKSLKLDTEQFKKDLKDSKVKASVNAQVDEGIKVGVNSTPTLYINGEMIEIPGNYEALKAQLDSALVPQK